eukprot:1161542-Pelagomonas_calceolata.AAC.7
MKLLLGCFISSTLQVAWRRGWHYSNLNLISMSGSWQAHTYTHTHHAKVQVLKHCMSTPACSVAHAHTHTHTQAAAPHQSLAFCCLCAVAKVGLLQAGGNESFQAVPAPTALPQPRLHEQQGLPYQACLQCVCVCACMCVRVCMQGRACHECKNILADVQQEEGLHALAFTIEPGKGDLAVFVRAI